MGACVLCLVLLAPLWVCEVPPLIDYPNHLARLFVLASLPGDPELAKFYAAHWSVIPNLALDIAGPPLMHVLPVYAAGRVLIAASVLLPVLGTVAYGTALGNRWWPLGAGLVGWNNCLLLRLPELLDRARSGAAAGGGVAALAGGLSDPLPSYLPRPERRCCSPAI